MKAILTLSNGDIFKFKSRAFGEQLEQGMFILSDKHTHAILFMCKAIAVESYETEGRPKPPKAAPKPAPTPARQETLTVDITATSAEAILDHLTSLISESTLHQALIEAAMTPNLIDKIAAQLAERPTPIQTPTPTPTLTFPDPMPGPAPVPLQTPAPAPAPAPDTDARQSSTCMPNTVANKKIESESGAVELNMRTGEVILSDTRAVLDHEKNGAGYCVDCDKMTRHGIKCPTLMRRQAKGAKVQEVACGEDAGLPK